MKTLTAKQEARLEKKKKKMAALAEIVKLNDKDRTIRTSCSISHTSEIAEAYQNNQSAKMVIINSDLRFDDGNIEPEIKKIKLESVGDFHHAIIDPALSKGSKSVSNTIVKNFGDSTICKNSSNETTDRFSISEEQYIQLKKELNERKRHLRHAPKVRLKQLGEQALLSVDNDKRTPIFLTDIQHLLMTALIGNGSPCYPSRWCHLERSGRLSHTTVLVIEGLSLFHFLSYESLFAESRKIFDQPLEVVMPPYKEGNIIEELAAVPLTNSQKDELIQTYGSLEAAIEISKDPTLMVKTVFPVENSVQSVEHNKDIPKCDKFPRTQLLLSALQMVDESYPLPLRGELALKYRDYIFTKDQYCKVTPHSPMYGLDCEMCRTTTGCNELTRISIVDENLIPLYETLVRPTNKIVDYLTEYSGITPEMMFNVTKTLKEVQNDVRRLLPCDAILVGQSLNADLHAMKMMHPYVIDTSVIFNLTGERKRKAKLQTLAKIFLGEIIQEGMEGHCPVEDSQASIKLTKLKLSQGVEFGDAILKGRKEANKILNEKKHKSTEVTNNLFGHVSKNEKRTVLITSDDLDVDLRTLFNNKVRIIGDEKLKNGKSEITIDWHKVECNKAIIRKAQEISRDYSLTIANLNIAPQKLEVSRIEKSISNIDKWISKQWNCVEHNGLFVVLLGGAPGSPSGVAMVKIKKSFSDVVSESSITT